MTRRFMYKIHNFKLRPEEDAGFFKGGGSNLGLHTKGRGSSFGANVKKPKNSGIHIIKRRIKNTANGLEKIMHKYKNMRK